MKNTKGESVQRGASQFSRNEESTSKNQEDLLQTHKEVICK